MRRKDNIQELDKMIEKIEENKYEIVMKDQDGEEKVYLYSEEDGKIVICENVDNEWIDYYNYIVRGFDVTEDHIGYDMIEEVEQRIRGKDSTFSAFVIAATRWALENLKEQEEENSEE